MRIATSLMAGGFALLSSTASAAITMPRMFDDPMVLQQDTLVNFWGRAIAGETITLQGG